MSIPSIMMPNLGSSSDGGLSIIFGMEGEINFTSTIPMSSSTSSGVGVPFHWNIPSGFGIVSSKTRGSSMLACFNFPRVSTPFPRETSLWDKFS
jgi:hypothetical protein